MSKSSMMLSKRSKSPSGSIERSRHDHGMNQPRHSPNLPSHGPDRVHRGRNSQNSPWRVDGQRITAHKPRASSSVPKSSSSSSSSNSTRGRPAAASEPSNSNSDGFETWKGCLALSDTSNDAMGIQLEAIPGHFRHGARICKLLDECSDGHVPTITITSFLSLAVLERFFRQRASLMVMKSNDSVRFAKLRSFLEVNAVAGLILPPIRPTEVMAMVPFSEAMAKGWRLNDGWSAHNLLVIYLSSIPLAPPQLKGPISRDLFSTCTFGQHLDWQTMALALRFPFRLVQEIQRGTYIEIHGDSQWAIALRQAHEVFKSDTPLRARRKMIFLDRYNDCRFNRDLTRLKCAKWPASFWEFGVPDSLTPSVPEVKEIFPAYTGGFITTDIHNIMHDSSILDRIDETIRQLNTNPAGGQWHFIFRSNILDRLAQHAHDTESAARVSIALFRLQALLANNRCEVVDDWSEQVQDSGKSADRDSAPRLMEQVLRQRCYTNRTFVVVNDIGLAADGSNRLPVIDEIPSLDLYKRLAMGPSD